MKYHQQYDSSDCGAACLSMIFSHYKKYMTLTQIREIAGTDINGTSFKGLSDACQKVGFKATGVQGSPSVLEIDKPCIAHIEYKEKNKPRDHYVVIKKAKAGKVIYWDPNPDERKRKVTYEEFKKNWTGKLLLITTDDTFKVDEKKDKSILWDFIPVILKHKKLLTYAILSSIVILIMGLFSSFFQKYLYDEVLFAKTKFSLNAVFIGMLILKVLSMILGAVRSIIVRHFSYKTSLQLNISFIQHLFKLPVSFFETRKVGEILSRLSDLSEVRGILSSIAMSTLIDVLMIMVVAPILLISNYQIFLISIICTVLIGGMSLICIRYYKRKYRKLKDEGAEVSSYLVDTVNGVNVVKSLNAEDMVFSHYEEKQMKVVDTSWKTEDFSLKHGIFNNTVNMLTDLLILWFGCTSILNGTLTLGSRFFLISLSGYLIGPLLSIATLQASIQQAMVSAERVGEILCLKQEHEERKLIEKELKGEIEFKDVCFHYGSRPQIIKNLSFRVKAGSTVALVGSSGCGKSTTIKLLLKFYKPDSGKIIIDGNDVNDVDTKVLRSQIGYVPQDTFLFPDTIINNITMCNDSVPLEDVIRVTELSGIHEHIISLPDRYHTKIGENGSTLSGGEKQRIAIARALLNSPPIIVLDEATSNLDSKSENKIHALIERLKADGVTVIVISHRKSTIEHCDNILFFQNGKITDSGRHDDLLKSNSAYKDFWAGREDENNRV